MASVSKVGNYEDFKDKIYELTSTEGTTSVIVFAPCCSDSVRYEPLLTKSIAEAQQVDVDIGDFSSLRDTQTVQK